MPEKKYKIELSKKEARFIVFCRTLEYGELIITVHKGEPHLCKEGFKNRRFDYDTEKDQELDKFFQIS